MKVKLIKPQIRIVHHNEIEIQGFVDENQTKYNNVSELLKSITEPTKIYCYLYQPIVRHLEKYAIANNFYFPACNSQSYYSGSPKKNTFSAIHLLTSASPQAAPHTSIVKLWYNEIQTIFLDVSKWMDKLNHWNVSPEEHYELWEVLYYIENNLIDTEEYVQQAAKSKSSKTPKTLASLSRNIIGMGSNLKYASNNERLKRIKGAYATGYNWIEEANKIYDKLYYLDVKSMYPFVMMNRNYPNPKRPCEEFKYFISVDNKTQLALYHIDTIVASVKPNHFPTIFAQQEAQFRMGLNGNRDISWTCRSALDGWITSIDYEMLLRDYDIEILDIDTTFLYNTVIAGRELFGEKIEEVFNMKENSVGVERQAYKLILNTYSGSIGMSCHEKYRVDSISNPTELFSLARKSSDEDVSPWDLSAFMTAYAREYITALGYIAGYNTVKCVSTDAIVVGNYQKVKSYIGNKLGDLSIDKVMYNVHWWRPNAYEWQDNDGQWHGKISGLPSYMYKHNKTVYNTPVLHYDGVNHNYCIIHQRFDVEGGNNYEE